MFSTPPYSPLFPLSPPPSCQLVFPLELNTRVRCRWKDGEFYRCKVLERRTLPEFSGPAVEANPAAAWEYYVHFSGSESSSIESSSIQDWGGCTVLLLLH